MTGYRLKGIIVFWTIVIILAFSLLLGDFRAAGVLFLYLILGMILYQFGRFAIRLLSGYDLDEGTTRSERKSQTSLCKEYDSALQAETLKINTQQEKVIQNDVNLQGFKKENYEEFTDEVSLNTEEKTKVELKILTYEDLVKAFEELSSGEAYETYFETVEDCVTKAIFFSGDNKFKELVQAIPSINKTPYETAKKVKESLRYAVFIGHKAFAALQKALGKQRVINVGIDHDELMSELEKACESKKSVQDIASTYPVIMEGIALFKKASFGVLEDAYPELTNHSHNEVESIENVLLESIVQGFILAVAEDKLKPGENLMA